MTRQAFFSFCLSAFGTAPDNPFDDGPVTAVLRHADNRKWFALVMRVSRRKFGLDVKPLGVRKGRTAGDKHLRRR